MKHRFVVALTILFFVSLTGVVRGANETSLPAEREPSSAEREQLPAEREPSSAEDPSATSMLEPGPKQTLGTVFVLPLEGPIDKSLMMIFRRAFREIERVQPDAVILYVNTPGGGLRETKEIGIRLLALKMPVYTFVNTDALSAGAILSFATDKIFMHPSATIGSALPILMAPGGGVEELPDNVEEKVLSSTRSLVRSYAQQKGHNEDVATAMVDPSLELTVGERIVCAEGKLLNLTAREATEIIPPASTPLLAEAVVRDVDELLAHVGLAGSEVVRFAAEPAERLARIIVGFGPILFTLGILGIFIEIRTPGFGLPGIAGIAMLAVFFFGHYVAGLAGLEDIVLVALGLLLLTLEVFVIPGFGIAGISGIILISLGTIMAMIPHLPRLTPDSVPKGFDGPSFLLYLEGALIKFVFSLALAFAGCWLLSLILPKTKMYGKIVLTKALSQEGGYTSHTDVAEKFLGKVGVATTLLRPAGIATIADERVDVVSSGELIAKGDPVRVIEVGGGRVVVEKVD